MSVVQELIEALSLEPIEVNLFRGFTPSSEAGMFRIFGGQVIAQSLMAAYRTMDPGRLCHSLQAYFIRPGDPKAPVLFEVERSRDGKSFATRRVIAIQHGEQILNLAASFQTPEEGFDHQVPMPKAPPPDSLPNDRDRILATETLPKAMKELAARDRAIDIRRVDPRDPIKPEIREPRQQCWFRASAPVGDDPVLNQVLLAYASDMVLLDTGSYPHGVSWTTGNIMTASLDHIVWFHRPVRFSDWHLYDMDSPSGSGARTFNRGSIYAADGTLVASVAQEGMIRRLQRK